MGFPVCPKCRLRIEKQPADACPHCGLIFSKYLAAERGEERRQSAGIAADDRRESWWTSLLDAPRISKGEWALRCIMFAGVAIWGFRVWVTDITQVPTFAHLTLIPFHEAGHILFWPLGTFMRVAGGTLGQWIIPIVCAVALHRQNGDNFGAALATSWLAMSIMDASVYAYDARNPVLPLIGGGTGADRFHDFVYLFGAVGQLEHAQAWGRFMHFVGTLVMLGSLAWAATILIRSRRNFAAIDAVTSKD